MSARAPIASFIVLALVALNGAMARADEIRVLSSVGIKAVVDELAPRFQRSSGHKVVATFDLASTLKTKIDSGAAFDVAILTPPLIDDLIAKRLVAAASRSIVARVGLGLMIRAGAAKPDASSVQAFARTLLAARSITYASAGASGIAFVGTIEKLGISAPVKAKAKPAASADEVAANITSGAADLAVLPISEILPVQGAELGAVFPADVQTYVLMVAGVSSAARGDAAREFVSFLMSPSNTAIVQTYGMER